MGTTPVLALPYPEGSELVGEGDNVMHAMGLRLDAVVVGKGELVYNVLDYGAKGDNTTDDSAAINATFTAARAANARVLFPSGRTYLGTSLDPTGINIDARGATLIHPPGGTGTGMFLPTNGFTLTGGTFDGNKANVTAPTGNIHSCVYLENAAGWSVPIRMTAPTIKNFHHRGVNAVGDRTILDATLAPFGAVILDRPVATNCGTGGFYFTGIEGVDLDAPRAVGCGGAGIYSHRTFRMRARDVFVSGTTNSHGYTSVHSVEDVVSGESSDNYQGGFVWGGSDPSGTYLVGRRHRIGKIIANRNGTGSAWAGVTFDPTIAGSSGIAQQIDAKVEQIIANNNSASGVQFTNPKDVFIGSATCDNNGLHGLSITAQAVTVLKATTRGNATHGIVEFGATTQYGAHSFGFIDSTGNGTTNTIPFQGTGTRLPSRFMGSPVAAQTVATQATFTFDCITYTRAKITAQATALTIANPSGTPAPMQSFVLRIKDSGSSRSIAYGSQFRAIGVTLPTATVASKTLYLGFVWNSDDTTWDCIAAGQQA